MTEIERAEQRAAYGKRMEKMYKRLSKYALDPDNKKMYRGRAEQWSEYTEKWQSYHEKQLANAEKSGIIKANCEETAGNGLHNIGRIDIEKYKDICEKRIITDEVIITENRIDHIVSRRGQVFYDKYSQYFKDIIEDPDYIFKDTKENTALVSKTIVDNGESINLVLKLVVEGDDITYKNSIITAIIENKKRFSQRLRNHKPVYKKFDK